MKRGMALALLFVCLSSAAGVSLEEVSSRMTSLGLGLTGIVPDPYTDVLRNPAYLARELDLLSTLTVTPYEAYRSGIFFNPTPFIREAKGGLIFTLQTDSDSRRKSTVPLLFPLAPFAVGTRFLPSELGLPPTDLIGSGRSFLGRDRTYPYPKSLLGSFSWASPITRSLGMGGNFVYGDNSLGSRRVIYYESVSNSEYPGSTRRSYYRSWTEADSKEDLRSLRLGVVATVSHRYSLDLDVTASQTRGSSFLQTSSLTETATSLIDTSYSESRTTRTDATTDPSDKGVIEGNLSLHRQGARGRVSLRLALFSGDARATDRTSDTGAEGDSISQQAKGETRTRARWTGGLAGLGASRELEGRPLTLFWGAFYGFLRGRQVEDAVEREGVVGRSTLTRRVGDAWDIHLWQFNLAAEYGITSSWSARLGGRTTALLFTDDIRRESVAEADSVIGGFEAVERSRDLVADAGLTAGVGFRATDRLRIDIFSPDLASVQSWQIESLITF